MTKQHNPTLKEWMSVFNNADPKSQIELLQLVRNTFWDQFKKGKTKIK